MRARWISGLTVLLRISAFSQGFYPLQPGNQWEYWDCEFTFQDRTVQVVSDTILSNGHSYATLLWSPGGGLSFMRQVGSMVYTRSASDSTEILRYDFSKTVGDTVAVHYHSGDTTVVTVVYDRYRYLFGRVLRQWGFWEQWIGSSLYMLVQVTDSLGQTSESVEAGQYDICLRGADINGIRYGTISSVSNEAEQIPDAPILAQNYPNPFNPTTVVRYGLPHAARVSVTVFNVLGQQVAVVEEGMREAGYHDVKFDGSNLASGVYLYRLQTGEFVQTRKFVLMK
jgi:hypothetical protein